MEIHLLGVSQTCTCEAQHVCRSCQGQDERLRAVNAKLLEALPSLNRFGHHDHACDGFGGVYNANQPCFCGFNQALDAARGAIEEANK